jgi:chorismate mutase
MRNYDEIIGKLITSAMDMERFVVESGEPLYVRERVREILRRINKLDEYMAYGADSELFKELVESLNK